MLSVVTQDKFVGVSPPNKKDSLYSLSLYSSLKCLYQKTPHLFYPFCELQGVATKLLKHFIQYVQENVKNVRKMGLICHDNLIPMYVKLGFQCRGLSEMPGGMFVGSISQ